MLVTNIILISNGQTLKSVSPTFAQRGDSVELFLYTSGTTFKKKKPIEVRIGFEIRLYNKSINDSIYVVNDTTLKVYFRIPNNIYPAIKHVTIQLSLDGSNIVLYRGFSVYNKLGGIPALKYSTPTFVRLGDTADILLVSEYTSMSPGDDITLFTPISVGEQPQIKFLNYNILNDTAIWVRVYVYHSCRVGIHLIDISSNSYSYQALIGVNSSTTEPHISKVVPESVYPGDSFDLYLTTNNIVFDTTNSLRVELAFAENRNPQRIDAKLVDSNTVKAQFYVPLETSAPSLSDVKLYYNGTVLLEYARLAIKSKSVVGITQLELNNEFAIYPNPVKDVLNIKLIKKINSIKIFNTLGQTTIDLTESITQEIDGFSIDIKSLSLPPGVYYLSMVMEDKSVFKRIVVE